LFRAGLRQRLEAGFIWVDIDPRWGITREQADNDQVLALCLAQIEECRPFFLGLLGGRYGWVPAKFSGVRALVISQPAFILLR